MAQPSSNSYLFNPALSDLGLEAFERCGIRSSSLTAEHMFNLRMSANLMLSSWTTKQGPNLWKQVLLSISLVPGVDVYSVPQNVTFITDYYLRTFQVGDPVNLTPSFTTVINTAAVTVNQVNHGLFPGQWTSVVVPVAVGGIVLLGFYEVQTVVSANAFTVTAASVATSSVTASGVVPLFTPVTNATTVTVTLPNHGLYANQNFSVQVPTLVGGITLSGTYTINAVVNANSFTITAPYPAGSNSAVYENGGLAQLEGQLPNTQPQDRVIYPISRTEYADQSDKFTQAPPTTVFFLRTIQPTLTLWTVPDDANPYVLYYWAVIQIQDAVLPGGATMDLPYRFFDAFAADLAARLARKYAPALVADLRLEAQLAWGLAAEQDTENVPLYITPGLSVYRN